MKVFAQRTEPKQQKRSAAHVASQKGSGENGRGLVDNRPEAAAQAQLQRMINDSPRMIAQRRQIEGQLHTLNTSDNSNSYPLQLAVSHVIQFGGKYDKEIEAYNKGKSSQNQIRDSEKKYYESLRDNGFEIGDLKMPKKGADFIAENADKLWIIEAKGKNAGSWTKDDNLKFKAGDHVPAKQIKETLESNQTKLKKLLEQSSSELFEKEALKIIVSGMSEDDALMALILDDELNIQAQHPVTISQVVRFIQETGGDKPEEILDFLWEEGADDIVTESMIEKASESYDEQEIALENYVEDWTKKNQPGAIANLDHLEVMYNAARVKNDHQISNSNYGANNPNSVKSLTTIKGKSDSKLHIRLVPISRRI